MEAALLLRGAILNAYGLIDTRLAEIALRCSVHDAYRDTAKDFPYGMPSRIAYLRQAFPNCADRAEPAVSSQAQPQDDRRSAERTRPIRPPGQR